MLVRDHWGRAGPSHWDSEYRAALHEALRSNPPATSDGHRHHRRRGPHRMRRARAAATGRDRAGGLPRGAPSACSGRGVLAAVVVASARRRARHSRLGGLPRPWPRPSPRAPTAGGGRGRRGRRRRARPRQRRPASARDPRCEVHRRRPATTSWTCGAGRVSRGPTTTRARRSAAAPWGRRATSRTRSWDSSPAPSSRRSCWASAATTGVARAAYDPHRYDVLGGLEGTIRDGLGEGIAKVFFPLRAACVGGWLVVTRRPPCPAGAGQEAPARSSCWASASSSSASGRSPWARASTTRSRVPSRGSTRRSTGRPPTATRAARSARVCGRT